MTDEALSHLSPPSCPRSRRFFIHHGYRLIHLTDRVATALTLPADRERDKDRCSVCRVIVCRCRASSRRSKCTRRSCSRGPSYDDDDLAHGNRRVAQQFRVMSLYSPTHRLGVQGPASSCTVALSSGGQNRSLPRSPHANRQQNHDASAPFFRPFPLVSHSPITPPPPLLSASRPRSIESAYYCSHLSSVLSIDSRTLYTPTPGSGSLPPSPSCLRTSPPPA